MRLDSPDVRSKFFGILIVATALLAGGTYYAQVTEREDQERCQANLNAAFARNIVLRSELSGQRQDAVDALLSGVGVLVTNPAKTKAEQDKARKAYFTVFVDYQNAVRTNDAARLANPYPDIDRGC